VSNWAVPNLITIVRILFVPAFAWAMLADAGEHGALRWVALALFVVGIGSDAIDGHLARSRNLISDLGKLPWWVTGLILLRELGITVWRLVEARRIVLPAGRGGKLKTVMQAIAISLAIAPLPALLGDWMHWVNGITMAAAFVLTIWSGIDYLVRAYWPKKTDADGASAQASGEHA
jgi:CDP-diacylglycerol--glycerol-3-phosphate 3-phosphatidyltransferase